jgi:glycosyltransferase involved in cell wall biosynthesis
MIRVQDLFGWVIGFRKPIEYQYADPGVAFDSKSLAVVTCYFNPTRSLNRKANFDRFYEDFKGRFSRVRLQVVELAFGDEAFELTSVPDAIQVRAHSVLWQKESLLSVGINRLIADGYQNIAWVDADILFEDPYWPERAVECLKSEQLCQLFTQSERIEDSYDPFSCRFGVVEGYQRKKKFQLIGLSCGYAWAARADLLKANPLYDSAILGGGDAAIWLASMSSINPKRWLKQVEQIKFFQSLGPDLRAHYLEWASRFGQKVQGRVGRIQQRVISLYHGKVKKRRYSTRYLSIPEFNPEADLIKNSQGCWEWSSNAALTIKESVRLYFDLRDEDEPNLIGDFRARQNRDQAPDTQLKPIRLCIQIPCYNEEFFLLRTLHALPKQIPGVSSIDVVVVDDGSSDQTLQVAEFSGVKHIVRSRTHRGLANAFRLGIQKCLSLGADIIVNLDADNQYESSCIEELIRPILENRADIALGARSFHSIPEFSKLKVWFQRFGSYAISKICRVKIPDAATGFRAFSRKSAMKINIFTKYTYTLETLIQAAQNGDKIVSVRIKTNPAVRPSRLFRHPSIYVLRSAGAVIRLMLLYNPLRVMGFTGLSVLAIGLPLNPTSELRSLFFVLSGGFLFCVGLLLDQVGVNRRLLESIRLMEMEKHEAQD